MSILLGGLFLFFKLSLGRKSEHFVLNCKLMCLLQINCKHLGKVLRFGILSIFSSSF